MSASVPRTSAAGAWTFFRQWLRDPLAMAAVAPSSDGLAAAMTAQLPRGTTRVIELGGGTGVITAALLDSGIAEADLLVLELNAALQQHLATRFPGVAVLQGDAGRLLDLAGGQGYLSHGLADAVVSGLGLLAMPPPLQGDILAAAFACLRPGGVFIQFTYGPAQPVAAAVVLALGLQVRRGDFVLRNVPPATVYVYRR